jgi:eukaryotic translation initiation factor 2C
MCILEYNLTLKDYPLLDMGSEQKPFTYVPAEVIEIQPGQAIKASLTMDETTAMLDFACRSPYANALSISTASRQVLEVDDPSLDKFGVSVEKHMLTVQGRVLNAPTVVYLNNQRKNTDVRPLNGSWNMRSVKVYKPGKKIDRWTWVNLALRPGAQPIGKDVVLAYGDFLAGMGIAINKIPQDPPRELIDTNANLDSIFAWLQKQGIQLFVIILSEKDTSGVYAKIKQMGDCTYGVHTSCVVARQFGKASPGYFANVGLKINLKAGGVNHKLKEEFSILKDGKTMIVGYDVTHPTNMAIRKGGPEPPSLVGFVSSIDSDLGQWLALSWEQTSRQEMLSNQLTDAFTLRLDTWSKHNGGQYPNNIVIYRDGVSEGQFSLVLNKELPSIREACRKKYSPQVAQPKITLVVSVKRHQTRFYPSSTDEMSKSGNIVNGTIVDRGVTQTRYWDFFLTAHDALQGTARPAHYTVILDEIFRPKFGTNASNELERLTHELCYLYGRATKAVSICPPAYYADIVCERARAHRPEWFEQLETENQTEGTGGSPNTVGRQVHVNLRDSMYYI